MPLVPGPIERLALERFNLGPGPILDLTAPLAFRAACSAVELGVFEALADGPRTPGQVAATAGASEKGIVQLLDALESLGYVRKRGACFVNTAMSTRWMVRRSAESVADMFGYFEGMFMRWADLTESIRRGRPTIEGREWFEKHPGGWRNYYLGNRAVAGMFAEAVIKAARLPAGARRLHDAGGGHGLYSVRFCQALPGLQAAIADWPTARAVAEETIAAHSMQSRVKFIEADLFTGDFGSGYDVALLFNVIHVFSAEQNAKLFRRAHDALAPGGTILVLDLFPELARSPLARSNLRLVMLELFNGTEGQTQYSVADISDLLGKAGFGRTRMLRLPRSPGFCLVKALR
jgi:SAM-dependent methyltransferase